MAGTRSRSPWPGTGNSGDALAPPGHDGRFVSCFRGERYFPRASFTANTVVVFVPSENSSVTVAFEPGFSDATGSMHIRW